jgi:hypothetical protein
MHIYETGTAADVSLVAATAKTVLSWICGATRASRILEVQLGFNSQAATDTAVLIEVVRWTTDGTGTATTPIATGIGYPAVISTSKYAYTIEPTVPTILFPGTRLTPQQGGTLIWQLPMTREYYCPVSNLIGIRLTCAQAQSGVRCSMTVEE